MTETLPIDILMVEDNPNDAELAIRALQKKIWPTAYWSSRTARKRWILSSAGARTPSAASLCLRR